MNPKRRICHCAALRSSVGVLFGLACLLGIPVRAQMSSGPESGWTITRFDVDREPGGGDRVQAGFLGIPWASYAMASSSDLVGWTPLTGAPSAMAPEVLAGQFEMIDSAPGGRLFYQAVVVPPGDVGTLDAHYYGEMGGICAAVLRRAVAYGHETVHGIGGNFIELGQVVESQSQALLGAIHVIDLASGYHVSWAGNEVQVPTPQQRDAAVQDFQQQRGAAQMALHDAERAMGDLEEIRASTMQAIPFGLAEAGVLQGELEEITARLLLPVGSAGLPHEAPLAGQRLIMANTDLSALQVELDAVDLHGTRLRAEAGRKRGVAAMPLHVFGVNGTWLVRWSNVELKFPSQAEAQATGVPMVEQIRAERMAEAAALDAEADGLEAGRSALASRLSAAQARKALLESDYETKLAAHPGGLVLPDDRPRAKPRWQVWIGFPPEYIDEMWEEMFLELQAAKDALRNQMLAMGAPQSTIDEAVQKLGSRMDPRRKWMSVFTGEPIKLTFFFLNQFTGYTIDPATVTWEVRYQNKFTGEIEVVPLGTGGELCLTPEQAQEIFQSQRNIGAGASATSGEQVVTLSARYTRVDADGTSTEGRVDQQVLIHNFSRAEYEEQQAGVLRH